MTLTSFSGNKEQTGWVYWTQIYHRKNFNWKFSQREWFSPRLGLICLVKQPPERPALLILRTKAILIIHQISARQHFLWGTCKAHSENLSPRGAWKCQKCTGQPPGTPVPIKSTTLYLTHWGPVNQLSQAHLLFKPTFRGTG